MKVQGMRRIKAYEELEFKDDFMFGKVMQDSELCRDVLECLLQRPVGKLRDVEPQGYSTTAAMMGKTYRMILKGFMNI